MVGQSFTVQSVGADSTLGFATNEWVELIDDDIVLTGATGALALIPKRRGRDVDRYVNGNVTHRGDRLR